VKSPTTLIGVTREVCELAFELHGFMVRRSIVVDVRRQRCQLFDVTLTDPLRIDATRVANELCDAPP
jgi:hypothetical protein